MTKKLVVILLVLLMVCSMIACSTTNAPANQSAATANASVAATTAPATSASTKVIKLGLCQPMTGSMATSGKYSKMGVDLAIKQINDAGGLKVGSETYKLELVVQDNEGKADITINAFNKLIGEDKVTAIIGTNSSGTSMAAGNIATAGKVPMVATTATNPEVTKVGGEYVFRSCWIDTYQGFLAAKMAYNLLGYKKGAALFNNADDYSTGIKDVFVKSFESFGGKVITQAYAGADVKDFKAQLTAIQSAGVEFIFIEAQAAEIPLPIKQIREMGLNVAIIGAASWDSDLLPKLAGIKEVEGCYFLSTFSADSKDPVAVAYVDAYKKAYDGAIPNNQSTMSYNAVKIIADALVRCGKINDSKALRDAIQATEINLPSGHLKYDENRNPQVTGNVMIYKNGLPSFVQTLE